MAKGTGILGGSRSFLTQQILVPVKIISGNGTAYGLCRFFHSTNNLS